VKKDQKIEKAVKEIVERIEQRFPEARVRGVVEWQGADAAIEVVTPEDNGWEISELTAPLQLKFLQELGVDIRVLPLEEHDGQKVE